MRTTSLWSLLLAVFLSASLVLPAVAQDEVSVPNNVAIARALTAALNAHDVETLVGLFSEEGPGATVHAERHAWTTFEIRIWAQQQVRGNIRVDAENYDVTQHGAAWTATAYRDDFLALGVAGLPMLNTIFVEDGKIMDFTSRLANPPDAGLLQYLWRPGSAPDYPAR